VGRKKANAVQPVLSITWKEARKLHYPEDGCGRNMTCIVEKYMLENALTHRVCPSNRAEGNVRLTEIAIDATNQQLLHICILPSLLDIFTSFILLRKCEKKKERRKVGKS
jgi:hypothetical protein